jgi:hypothetical protein
VNVDWLLTTQGRLARIAAGTLLILIGLGVVGGFLGVILLLIGAVPIASAAYGTLLIGPLFGRDIRGRTPQPKEEEPPPERSDEADAEPAPAASEDDWSAPPLATAERPPGQEARTRDLRADED